LRSPINNMEYNRNR